MRRQGNDRIEVWAAGEVGGPHLIWIRVGGDLFVSLKTHRSKAAADTRAAVVKTRLETVGLRRLSKAAMVEARQIVNGQRRE